MQLVVKKANFCYEFLKNKTSFTPQELKETLEQQGFLCHNSQISFTLSVMESRHPISISMDRKNNIYSVKLIGGKKCEN